VEGESPNKRKTGEPSKKKWKLPRPPKVNAALKVALKAKAKEGEIDLFLDFSSLIMFAS